MGSTDLFEKACNNFNLTISTKKTETLYQLGLVAPHFGSSITVKPETKMFAQPYKEKITKRH